MAVGVGQVMFGVILVVWATGSSTMSFAPVLAAKTSPWESTATPAGLLRPVNGSVSWVTPSAAR